MLRAVTTTSTQGATGIADLAALQGQARDQAMAGTKAHARQLAKDAGTMLDDPITMSETINNGPVPFYAERAATPSAGGGTRASVRSGQSSVQIQANVTHDMH